MVGRGVACPQPQQGLCLPMRLPDISLSLTYPRFPSLSPLRHSRKRVGKGPTVTACPAMSVCRKGDCIGMPCLFLVLAPSTCFPYPESQGEGFVEGKQRSRSPQRQRHHKTNEEMMVGRGCPETLPQQSILSLFLQPSLALLVTLCPQKFRK